MTRDARYRLAEAIGWMAKVYAGGHVFCAEEKFVSAFTAAVLEVERASAFVPPSEGWVECKQCSDTGYDDTTGDRCSCRVTDPAPPDATEGEAAGSNAAGAEPVAWRYRHREPKWLLTDDREYAEWIATHVYSAAEPLYPHPAPAAPDRRVVDVVFDGPPGPISGRFVEVESPDGRGLDRSVGEWVHRDDGYWALRLTVGCDVSAPHRCVAHCPECVERGYASAPATDKEAVEDVEQIIGALVRDGFVAIANRLRFALDHLSRGAR